MKSFLTTVSALAALTIVASAQKKVDYPVDEPIFSITFPENWTVEVGESVSAASEDTLANMELIALDSEALEAAIEAAKDSLKEQLEELKWVGEPEKGELNGMDVRFLNANAKIEDVPVAVNCAVFAPKGKDTFFMLFNIIPLEALKDHGDAISKIINSVEAK